MFKDVKFHFQNFFAIYAFSVIVIILMCLLYFEPKLDDMNKGIIIGFLIGSANTAINFALGTSKGSAKKDEAIQDLTKAAAKVDAEADANLLNQQQQTQQP